MPDFQHVQSPFFPPTICLSCMTHHDKKGFVDLLAENAAGRAYMCATCVEMAGRKIGMLSKRQAHDLGDRLAQAQNEIIRLEEELDVERDDKVVSLADVKTLLAAPAAPHAA